MVLGNLKGVLACVAALLFGQVALGQDDAPQVDGPIVSAAEVAAAEAKCDAALALDCLAFLALDAYISDGKRGNVGRIVAMQMGAGDVEAAVRTARFAPDDMATAVLLPDKTLAVQLMRKDLGVRESSADPKHFARMEQYVNHFVRRADVHAQILYGNLDTALNAARMTGPLVGLMYDRDANIAYVGEAALEAGNTSMAISIAMEVRNAEVADELFLMIIEQLCDEGEFDRAEGAARLIRNDDRRASGLAVVGDAVARFGAKSDAARLFGEAFDLLQAEAVFPDDKARRFLDLATAQFEAGFQADAKVSALRALDWSRLHEADPHAARSYRFDLRLVERAEIATLLSQVGAVDQAVVLRDELLAATRRPYVDRYDVGTALQLRVSLLQFGGSKVTASELREIVMLRTLPWWRDLGSYVTVSDYDFVFGELTKRGLARETIIIAQIGTWFDTHLSLSVQEGYQAAVDVDPALVESALRLIFNDVVQNEVRIIVAQAYAERFQPDDVSRVLQDVVAHAESIDPQSTSLANRQVWPLAMAASIYADVGLHRESRAATALAYLSATEMQRPSERLTAYVTLGYLLLELDRRLAD